MRLMTVIAVDDEGADRRCSGPILTRTPCSERTALIALSQRVFATRMSTAKVSSLATPKTDTHLLSSEGAARGSYCCSFGHLFIARRPSFERLRFDIISTTTSGQPLSQQSCSDSPCPLPGRHTGLHVSRRHPIL